MSYTPLANVLKRNLRDLRKYIIRDYNEIEDLQSSLKDSKIFIQKSKNKIEEKLETIKKFYDPILESFDESKINIDKTVQDLLSFYDLVKELIVDNSFIKKRTNKIFEWFSFVPFIKFF